MPRSPWSAAKLLKPWRSSATAPPISWPMPSWTSTRRPRRGSARPSKTGSTTTSCGRRRSPREDLAAIEKKMRELARAEHPHRAARPAQGRGHQPLRGPGPDPQGRAHPGKGRTTTVTCYRQGGFVDFCLGPHVASTGLLKHFKLLSVSGAYWKGDEKGQQLQRIYGTVFSDQEGARRLPGLPRGGQKARPPQARPRARPLQLRRRARRRPDPVAPQGRADPGRHRAVLARAPLGRRLRHPLHPAHRPRGPLADLGPPGVLQGQHVLADGDRRAELLPEADELPVPHP